MSNQNRALLFDENGQPTARSQKILAGTPAGRFVESNELLGGVFFLCDDRAASAVTGVIPADRCRVFGIFGGIKFKISGLEGQVQKCLSFLNEMLNCRILWLKR